MVQMNCKQVSKVSSGFMRVGIIRRAKGSSFSMDVYADGIISGLKAVRPDWELVELTPNLDTSAPSFLKSIVSYYKRYWAYPQRFKARKVDIFHVIDHSDGHYVYTFSKCQQPVVVTCHDLINFIQPQNITDQSRFPAISQFIWKYAVQGICKANNIITVSAHTKQDVETLLQIPSERITVIPNAVDPAFHILSAENKTAFLRDHNLPEHSTYLLNVGSNHPRKNVFSILKALKQLRDEGLVFHFLKAGADFTPEQKQFLEVENLTQNVIYLGQPTKDELINIYNVADILVSPSLYEGFGITILEAMACGTPVITSNTTSLPEVVGDAGIMVNPDDVDAISSSIHRLCMDSTSYEKMATAGLTRANNFSWDKTAEKVAHVYEQILNS